MLGFARSRVFGRNVMKNFIRNGSHGGIPGENLPIDITSRTKVTLHFFIYTLTGFSSPFLLLMFQMKKK